MAEKREETRAERAEEARAEEARAEEAKAEEAKVPMPKRHPRVGDSVLHHGAAAIVTHVHGPRHVSVASFTRAGYSNVAEPQEYDRDWTERPEE